MVRYTLLLVSPSCYNSCVRIYLIRHVTTEYNITGIYMGRTYDISVDSKFANDFKQKAISNTGFFKNVSVVISSPSIRCIQTSSMLLESAGVTAPVTIDLGFMETDMGKKKKKTAQSIEKEYPNEFELWRHSSTNFVFPGGESYLAVQQRSYDALNAVVTRTPDSLDLVIVSHVDVIKMLIFKILGVSVEMKKFLYIDNGSISCLETYKDGYKVKFMNL